MEVSGVGATPPAPGTRQAAPEQPPADTQTQQTSAESTPPPADTSRGKNVDTSA
jgi:hypothetical protein